MTTLAGSIIRSDASPAARDAPLIARLKVAGAIPVGALDTDEFAYGFVTDNAHYGPTHNPHDLARIAGGSSGGSATRERLRVKIQTLGSNMAVVNTEFRRQGVGQLGRQSQTWVRTGQGWKVCSANVSLLKDETDQRG